MCTSYRLAATVLQGIRAPLKFPLHNIAAPNRCLVQNFARNHHLLAKPLVIISFIILNVRLLIFPFFGSEIQPTFPVPAVRPTGRDQFINDQQRQPKITKDHWLLVAGMQRNGLRGSCTRCGI